MRGLTIKGLRFGWRGVVAVETGARVAFDRELWRALKGWLPYATVEVLQTRRRDIIPVRGLPNMPAPYYLLWGVLRRAGLRAAKDAELSLLFTDQTVVEDFPHARGRWVLNGDCRDISKSRVAEVFEEVFGYALGVDPETHVGPMVRKSEVNGDHSGEIVEGPCAREAGWVYQRAVDNAADGFVADLRCPTAFGEVPIVCIKRREVERRFDNYNAACDLAEPEDIFSVEEIARISEFCRAMRLDWGGLDILRDAGDGRIYIVDVNKTDMPVLVLSTREKLEVSRRLAKALRDGVEARLRGASGAARERRPQARQGEKARA